MQRDDHERNQLVQLRIHRRRLLQSGGIVASGALVGASIFPSGTLANAVPAERVHTPPEGIPRARALAQDEMTPRALSAQEMATLRAVVGRLIPTDALGPGADEAGVHVFIDRGLESANSAVLPAYQALLAALDAEAGEVGFVAITPDQQDQILTNLEAGNLPGAPENAFAILLEQTREGMFGDPVYGGNQDFAGWDLLGYAGIKLLWSQADQEIDASVAPQHLSVAQFGGTGW